MTKYVFSVWFKPLPATKTKPPRYRVRLTNGTTFSQTVKLVPEVKYRESVALKFMFDFYKDKPERDFEIIGHTFGCDGSDVVLIDYKGE